MDFSKMMVTGGIFAAVAAGWQQVRATLGYISRLLIIRASVNNSALSYNVLAHLREAWRLLPDGLHTYNAISTSLRGNPVNLLVPFRVLNQTMIFWKFDGWKPQLVFVTSGYHQLKLAALRGTVDFNALVSSGARRYADLVNTSLSSEERVDRFFVKHIVGQEKSAGSMMNMRRDSPGNSSDSYGEAPMAGRDVDYIGSEPNLEYDHPLLYSKDDFQKTEATEPFEPYWFPNSVMSVVRDCERWLDSADWYKARSIPWRRGVLLYGPGGTGKSSLALATARRLKIPLHQFFLATLSDQEFLEAWDTIATPGIVLFEDFDNVFHGREPQTQHKSLTFDCVLNTLSGVSGANGVLLFVTTNHIEKLDPALGVSPTPITEDVEGAIVAPSTRPGRIDQVVYLGNATYECKSYIAHRCLQDWPGEAEYQINTTKNCTPAQFQELCVERALQLLASNLHTDTAK